MSGVVIWNKKEKNDYVSVQTTSHESQPHLQSVSTQTTLAGHKDPNEQQIFNPPRDIPKRRKHVIERNRRRTRDKKKPLSSTAEEQRTLNNVTQTAGKSDSDDGGEDENETDDEAIEGCSHDRNTTSALISSTASAYSSESSVDPASDHKDSLETKQFLVALQNVVEQSLKHLQETREKLRIRGLMEHPARRKLDAAIDYLELATSALDSERGVLREGD